MIYTLTAMAGAVFGCLVSALMFGASANSKVEEAYLYGYEVGKNSSK